MHHPAARRDNSADPTFDYDAPWPGKRSAIQRSAGAEAWPGKRTAVQGIANPRSAGVMPAANPRGASATPAGMLQAKRLVTATSGLFSGVPIQRSGDGGDYATGSPPAFGAGSALAPEIRARMESAFGGSFASVRIHESSYAAEIGAHAFTRGTDIVFAPGMFDPASQQGLALLGHELTHVVQQAEGRVAVTAQIGGAPANDDAGLEAEATRWG